MGRKIKKTETFYGTGSTASGAVENLNQKISNYFGEDMWRVLHISHTVNFISLSDYYESTAIVLYEDKTPEEETGEKSDNVKALEATFR